MRASRRLAAARTCYDHLAGRLGVGLLDAFVAAGHLSARDGLAVTDAGRDWFTAFVGPGPFTARSGRALVRPCLDWTERRHHLGGALGAAVCRELVEREWLRRAAGDRAVTLTDAGRVGLADLLGELAPPAAAG